jgi:hypothetical protein
MKIGLRLGLCIRDIMTGKVAIEDVFVLVLTSKFNPVQTGIWEALWKVYGKNEWNTGHDQEQYKELIMSLYNQGKIHQPKMFGGAGHPYRQTWMEMVEAEELIETSAFETRSIEPVKSRPAPLVVKDYPMFSTVLPELPKKETVAPSTTELSLLADAFTTKAVPLPTLIPVPESAVPNNEKIKYAPLSGMEVSEIADFSAFEHLDLDLSKP